jgi:hypothetical protein
MDIFGIITAIIGAVTVVLSSNASDTRLDPPALLKALVQPPFLAYAITYVVVGTILAGLSERSPGTQTPAWVCVDVGLCAIFGECSEAEQFREPAFTSYLRRWIYCPFDKRGLNFACD